MKLIKRLFCKSTPDSLDSTIANENRIGCPKCGGLSYEHDSYFGDYTCVNCGWSTKTIPKGVEKSRVKENKPVAMKTAVREHFIRANPEPLLGIEEQYVNDCLERKYKEIPETRSWDSEPAFRKIIDPLNSGQYQTACREAEALVAQFGDFFCVYGWWGIALQRMGSLKEARQVVKRGIDSAKKKYPLCNQLGEIEWKAHDLKLAVYWWAQGLHCQESLRALHYGGNEGAYFYLHYVAEGLRLSECSKAFLTRVDYIRPGMIRLNPEAASDLTGLARRTGTPSVERVLKELVQIYKIPGA